MRISCVPLRMLSSVDHMKLNIIRFILIYYTTGRFLVGLFLIENNPSKIIVNALAVAYP